MTRSEVTMKPFSRWLSMKKRKTFFEIPRDPQAAGQSWGCIVPFSSSRSLWKNWPKLQVLQERDVLQGNAITALWLSITLGSYRRLLHLRCTNYRIVISSWPSPLVTTLPCIRTTLFQPKKTKSGRRNRKKCFDLDSFLTKSSIQCKISSQKRAFLTCLDLPQFDSSSWCLFVGKSTWNIALSYAANLTSRTNKFIVNHKVGLTEHINDTRFIDTKQWSKRLDRDMHIMNACMSLTLSFILLTIKIMWCRKYNKHNSLDCFDQTSFIESVDSIKHQVILFFSVIWFSYKSSVSIETTLGNHFFNQLVYWNTHKISHILQGLLYLVDLSFAKK